MSLKAGRRPIDVLASPYASRLNLLRSYSILRAPAARRLYRSPPTIRFASSFDPRRPSLDSVSLHRLEEERRAYYQRRSYYAAGGAVVCMIAALLVTTAVPKEHSDARPDDPLHNVERGTPVVRGVTGGAEFKKIGGGPPPHDDESLPLVPTGTSVVPTFPKTLNLGRMDASGVDGKAEYQLVGLGIRTVSFLGIQVYVVGLYVATEDIALLQQALIRKMDPVATTLINSEKDKLRSLLLDSEQSEKIWTGVLKETAFRSAIRVVPTRNTDFQHLRDGWVRGITARSQSTSRAGNEEYDDEKFGLAMRDFKGVFSGGARKSVPKSKTLLLMRDRRGALNLWYDEDVGGQEPLHLGGVDDERIGRLLWMGYLGGKQVASEGARASVVEGIMELVERPVGTVATQVL
ncbi:MAG: Altered inheritance of mitochondria protein 18 mitochondrial [Thelocarpon superellum]|nr:MAG: Altered inheritance of mitochondria protein 18 mitochondrial [Thelocarpon superellum]